MLLLLLQGVRGHKKEHGLLCSVYVFGVVVQIILHVLPCRSCVPTRNENVMCLALSLSLSLSGFCSLFSFLNGELSKYFHSICWGTLLLVFLLKLKWSLPPQWVSG